MPKSPQGMLIECPHCGKSFAYLRMYSMGEVAAACGVGLERVYHWANNGTLQTRLRYLGMRANIRQYVDGWTLSEFLEQLFPMRSTTATDKANGIFHRRKAQHAAGMSARSVLFGRPTRADETGIASHSLSPHDP